jgi:hypothetical protein
MASPNLIATTSIIGKTQAEWVPATITDIISNSINSSEIYRINVLFVTNLGVSDATVTIELYRNSISFKIVSGIPVTVGDTMVAIAKDTSIYLEEGDSLRISASEAGVLQYVASYEIMG